MFVLLSPIDVSLVVTVVVVIVSAVIVVVIEVIFVAIVSFSGGARAFEIARL